MSLNLVEQTGSTLDQHWTDEDVKNPDVLPKMGRFNILVRPLPVKKKTKSGIILPGVAKENLHYLQTVGQVVAMGPDCFPEGSTPACKVGDNVLWARGRGIRLSYQGVKFVILVDDEVLATIENPTDLDEHYATDTGT